uniref:Uncharacterized protein n=1 Tax=Arundo donax TaxID=35708 RepID=A0A0A9DSZ5_ARUDO
MVPFDIAEEKEKENSRQVMERESEYKRDIEERVGVSSSD